ncbi:hypothetical protein M422DRAFT_30047 [Sphaerobolus stellatus SS14]|uniref:E3 ubiquitin-protein ligase n=1 Tax=Sphaerobolus stellatus (strain SS14) TaxID=990650 RepID=A0A0C9UQI5_SPHS4|nr:hypothetical protein M422DRAFT_30047 [Sphaerobolus stellatus SS14]
MQFEFGPREYPATDTPLLRLQYHLEKAVVATGRPYVPQRHKVELFNLLYESFWGDHVGSFLPGVTQTPNMQMTLSEMQARYPSNDPPIPGRSCGHIFQKGECCYRCKDCALDDSSVMCSRCFHATEHEGHNITFYISHQPGGCCDCGDSESWRIRPNCPYHPPSETSVPPTTLYLTSVLDVWSPSKHPQRPTIPQDLRDSMIRTIALALDYVLDTLDLSPDDTTPPRDTGGLFGLETADPLRKDTFSVVLWNDDKHSFEEVVHNVCEATGIPSVEAAKIVDRIDEEGREIIEMGDDMIRLLDIGMRLHQIDLGVTTRRSYDALREQAAAVIIEWLLDLTRSKLGSDPFILRELVTAQLLTPRMKKGRHIPNFNRDPSRVYLTDVDAARLDWLFLYHARLWKKPRLSLKQMYVSIITLGREYKLVMASRFATMYHRIIDSFLLVDREGETSVKYFALQLFTVPSVAAHVVRHHDVLPRLHAIITAFFTEQINGTRIMFPPNPHFIVDPESKAFKSKRFIPVFADLRYLVANHTVQSIICQNSSFITGFAKVCQMFMGIHPNVRLTVNHVEYESETWINVFNVTLSLSRVVKAYGEAYCKGNAEQLIEAIHIVVEHILVVCTLQENRLDRTKYAPMTYHIVDFCNQNFRVVDFDCLNGAVSFHHALHWLLAELFKHVHLLTEEALEAINMHSLRDAMLSICSEMDILTLIDFPLRVLSMVAQIRTGLWVRNGFAIRGQLLHYRDFMLRELCYDQDLYLLQTAFIILDPAIVLTSMLDRFQLLSWFSGNQDSPVYETAQVSSMVEEFLYVLITCLSEYGNAKQLSMKESVRRELTHALATGSCGFTDICKRVPERMVEDVCFEGVLNEVANFKPPRTTTDSGVYELKEECFDDINPYFFHYPRSKREEVEPLLKEHLKKKDKSKEPVIIPKPLKIESGPFVGLSQSFQSSVLHQIVFFSLYNVVHQSHMTPPTAEAIVDQGLHLTMLGLIEQPQPFSRHSAYTAYHEAGGQTLIDVLCGLEHNDRFKSLKPKVEWCLDNFSQYVPSAIIEKRKVLDAGRDKGDLEGVKKRAAKARQAAMMKQFAAAQQTFMDKIDVEEDDDEMEEDTPTEGSFGPCLVCQEALDNSQPWGMLGFIQASKLIRRAPEHSTAHVNEVLASSFSLDRPAEMLVPPIRFPAVYASDSLSSPFNGFPQRYIRFGMHGSGCGHMMHLGCFANYILGIRQRHRMQAQRNHPENLQRKEFICPLCKSLGNVIIPVVSPLSRPPDTLSFPDWMRTTGINLLKSAPDRLLESLHFKSGSGEFVFWTAQDTGYPGFPRHQDRIEPGDTHKMVDTLMTAAKLISGQSRHLRDRIEQEPGERGGGMYLPEDLVGYTLSCIEVSARGTPVSLGKTVADQLTESQGLVIRGMLSCLTKLAALQFKDRPDGGRDAIRQAIVKRLLPEWRREPAFQNPLLLRDPLAILVETAAVSPESLRYVTILTYYASLARTTIGLVQLLNKSQSMHTYAVTYRNYKEVFGDLGTFVMSVVRHSSLLEHTAEVVLETFGEEKFAKFLHNYSLSFLRRAVLLRKAVHPSSLSPAPVNDNMDEYRRLLTILGIPPLSNLSSYDTIQNALSGWCAHYGYLNASHPLECVIPLDYPIVYNLAQLPYYLDDLFGSKNSEMHCSRCRTVPADPAICLLCGVTVCFQSHCCTDPDQRNRGECNMHTRECGGVIGAYFIPKRCCVLYLFGGNGSFAPAPYLDVHGEIDFSMRRGRRQCLHDVRAEEIRKLWLNHGIPTFIARKLEGGVDPGGWEQL